MDAQFVLLICVALCNAHNVDDTQGLQLNENIKEYIESQLDKKMTTFKEDFFANTKAILEQEIREQVHNEWKVKEAKWKVTEAKLSDEILHVKQQLEMERRFRRQVNGQGGPGIAFFARLTADSPPLSPNQDIVFNDVQLNIGSAYHATHGAFIAPLDGVYVFTTSILSHVHGANYAAHAKLVKNGTLLAILDASEPDGIAQAGQTVIIQLKKNDDIAVQNADYSGVVFMGSNYSTFSGFLLYDLSDDAPVVGK